jgi:hypothetical protein
VCLSVCVCAFEVHDDARLCICNRVRVCVCMCVCVRVRVCVCVCVCVVCCMCFECIAFACVGGLSCLRFCISVCVYVAFFSVCNVTHATLV